MVIPGPLPHWPMDQEMWGKVVRVVSVKANPQSMVDGMTGPQWIYEAPLLTVGDGVYTVHAISDDCLRPLRSEPGTDESLSWKVTPLPTICTRELDALTPEGRAMALEIK
jgi:hypothetical protein